MASLPAMRSSKPSAPLAEAFMRESSPSSASIFSAFLMETSSRSGLTGLTTKSTAPARMAEMAASMPPWAVCTMAGGFRGRERMARQHRHAVGPGHDEIEQDEADVAGGIGLQRGSALSPLSAVVTV